jgi:tRNA threonylcarbamoyladenosine modification (KEOPS) complex  Pcc1 subunit
MNMKVNCTIELSFDSPTHATQIYESVKIDDASFMDSKIQQNSIHTKIKTSSISSMVHTIDDYLACVRVAENIIDNKK